MNFAKFIWTPFLQKTSGRLLLIIALMPKLINGMIRDHHQISLLMLWATLNESINLYSPWNYQKTIDFQMISGGNNNYMNLNLFILQSKSGNDPLSVLRLIYLSKWFFFHTGQQHVQRQMAIQGYYIHNFGYINRYGYNHFNHIAWKSTQKQPPEVFY